MGDPTGRLAEIAANLRVLAVGAPQTFEQAVQLFFLMWSIRGVNCCSCIGRLDVHLSPFYQADTEAGRTTRDEAFRLLCELWERLNTWGSGDTLMNVMVGGCNPDGSDASSEISLMMLEASYHVRRTEPHINVRVHRNIRPDILEAVYRLQYLGHGQATIYNDDVVIPSMLRCGIPAQWAYRYANDGCTEIVWDGGGRIDFSHVDAVAAVELALYNGRLAPKPQEAIRYYHKNDSPTVPQLHIVEGFESGAAEVCTSFEDFYALFMRQYLHQIERQIFFLREQNRELRDQAPTALFFLNGTYDEVLESGVGLLRGGLPMDSYMVFLGSIPTVADCLAAMKRVIFEEKRYSVAALKTALEANFDGYEEMRQHLLSVPKFGNDIDEVDGIAARLVADCCDYIDAYRAKEKFPVFPALIGWLFLQEAYSILATPDGRKRKEPIAEHYCATPGKAVRGVTALINSIAKAPLSRALGVAATHLSLPRNFAGSMEDGISILRVLNQVCLEKGLMEFNIAIYDADTLRDAQEHPDRHRDLIVRVWGFCARFIDLSREMQDHVLRRILTS